MCDNTKNIFMEKILPKKQKGVVELNNFDERECINQLYLTGTCKTQPKEIISNLDKKIRGYKSQDMKKNIHNAETIVTREDVLEKLVCSKLKCFYCSQFVKIIYQLSRAPNQWTLDRIDNDKNHNKDNVVICCLDCNLKRRRRDSDKFYFTKNLSIKKV